MTSRAARGTTTPPSHTSEGQKEVFSDAECHEEGRGGGET